MAHRNVLYFQPRLLSASYRAEERLLNSFILSSAMPTGATDCCVATDHTCVSFYEIRRERGTLRIVPRKVSSLIAKSKSLFESKRYLSRSVLLLISENLWCVHYFLNIFSPDAIHQKFPSLNNILFLLCFISCCLNCIEF